MKKFFLIALISIAALAVGGGGSGGMAGPGDRILRLEDRAALGLGQILPDLRLPSIIFVGEKHDEPSHHDLQLRLIRTLRNVGVPVAVGLEMFTARDQGALDHWVAGQTSENDFARIFRNNWGNSWELYREIFLYARDRRIPLVGLNVPNAITVQVAREGFDSLNSEQLRELPGVSCDVDEKYRNFIRLALSVHGQELEDDRLERFCEAQMVWDTTMAFRLASYLEQNRGSKVLVLAGSSHAWKPGIPDQLDRFREGIDYRVILPEVIPAQTRKNVDDTLADYLWLVD